MTLWNKTCAVLALSLALPVAAWGSLGPDTEHAPPKPPQQAIDACSNKTEGASVQLTGPNGETMTGTCKNLEGVLAAVPEGRGEPPEGMAPPKDGIKEPWEQ